MGSEMADWDGAIDALEKADEVVALCHVNPDGDALGSLLGASLALEKMGKKVRATWHDGTPRLPAGFGFLPGADLLVPASDVPASAVVLALDCGARDRLGDLEWHVDAAEVVVNVDHHRANDNFGTFNIVCESASSTAEIVARMIADLGVELDRDIATCLYVGIVTDTGRFQYANSSPETLRLTADLLGHGVDAPGVAVEVFESAPFGYLKLLGRVLERATLCASGRFVHSYLKLEDLEDTGVAPDEADALIDQVRGTRDADVAALLKEQPDGTYRVSLRSKGRVNVGTLARARGGGGHDRAAGFTAERLEGTAEELCRTVSSQPPLIER
jgi:bifunctional oligoribonuclease and PAP phosphatase NrnA